jgi:hypothetical protein
VTAVTPADNQRRTAVRQAVRASIQPTTEEGVYRLQLLQHREEAEDGTYEAMVVLIDPTADLFAD